MDLCVCVCCARFPPSTGLCRDFVGEDFRGHTNCISEAYKYEGKLYVPKGGKKANPQEEFVAVLERAAASKGLAPRLAGHLTVRACMCPCRPLVLVLVLVLLSVSVSESAHAPAPTVVPCPRTRLSGLLGSGCC